MLKIASQMYIQHMLKQDNNKPGSNEGSNGEKSYKGIKKSKQDFRS